MAAFNQLGPALRHLRLQAGRRQKSVAAEAKVTRAMLSSYENGHQLPSLQTLERILDALGCDLAQLQWAIGIVATAPGDEPEGRPYPTGTPGATMVAEPPAVEYRIVDLPTLEAEEEEALGQMLSGFVSWMRLMRNEEETVEAADGPDGAPAADRPRPPRSR